MLNLLITEPTPVRTADRCEGVPLNRLTKAITAPTMGGLYDAVNDWLIADDTVGITIPIYNRVEGILKNLACDDHWQAGKYSFKFWSN